MWRNWRPHTLLVGLSNGTATLEKSLEFLKILYLKLPYDPAIPLTDRQTGKQIDGEKERGYIYNLQGK